MQQTEFSISSEIIPLCELKVGEEGDFFAQLTQKEELTTKRGDPFFRVAFRDSGREVGFPIWNDAPLAEPCRHEWRVGEFYKLRATLVETEKFGLQLEVAKIRPVEDADRDDGFDPTLCQPAPRFDPVEMFAELVGIAQTQITDDGLQQLVTDIMDEHRELLLELPAAKFNHHAHLTGYLEHVLNVTRNCCYLADYYAKLYDRMDPPLSTDVAIAGAILHDIGKARELASTGVGAEYTVAGTLIGHILQGRDIIREAAAGREIDPELLLRLEHVIVAHQRLPEWGSPKPPMTPEAMIVHYADDLDAKLETMAGILADDTIGGPLTSGKNPLGNAVYRGGVV